MQQFTAHRLTFVTQAQSLVEINEHQGSALRGALFHALRRKFCHFSRDRRAECGTCALATTCPVATLVSTLAPGHQRGQDRPRPYTLQPPLPGSGHPWEHEDGRVTFRYEPGETLTFGLTLYAEALTLFPYVILAMAAGAAVARTLETGYPRRAGGVGRESPHRRAPGGGPRGQPPGAGA